MAVVLVAHPSAELYGSDRMVLETVRALGGHRVVVATAVPGPLQQAVRDLGAEARTVPVPVLRKAAATVPGVLGLALGCAAALWPLVRVLRRLRPRLVLVNTVTVPVWVLAARLAGVRTVVHVHEAEAGGSRAVHLALHAPLRLAHGVLVNSAAARAVVLAAAPWCAGRLHVVHNGVPGPPPPAPVPAPAPHDPPRLLLVGRLSPRKGTDLAVAALARVHRAGVPARLVLAGDVYPGYDWFERRLRADAAALGVAGHVTFAGFVPDVWPLLADCDVVLVPSRAEPFGNVAVEAMLAARPVVAAAVQGLTEIVEGPQVGRSVPADDAPALADAVLEALADWPGTRARTARAATRARDLFTPEAYAHRLRAALTAVAPGPWHDHDGGTS